jgi:hypothetical protein
VKSSRVPTSACYQNEALIGLQPRKRLSVHAEEIVRKNFQALIFKAASSI